MTTVLPLAAAADVMGAIADLIWPLLVLGVVLFGYRRRSAIAPALREILSTRDVSAELPGGFKLDVGGQPVPAQQVADDQREHTENLRRDLSALAAQVAVLTAAQAERPMEAGGPEASLDATSAENVAGLTRRVLWVDDRPTNNAYEIAALKDRGVEVELATSTAQAVQILIDDPVYDALVTDMGRVEDGGKQPTAGLTLLRKLHKRKLDLPAVVYASTGGVQRHAAEAIELGAVGVTANPSELLELLAVNYGPRFSLRFERQVRGVIDRSPWELVEQQQDTRVDFLVRRDSRQLGIEAKPWVGELPPQLLQKELEGLAEANTEFPIWIVTPSALMLPSEVALPAGIEVLPLQSLASRLAGE